MIKKQRYDALSKGLGFMELLVGDDAMQLEAFLDQMSAFLREFTLSDSCLIYVYEREGNIATLVGLTNGNKKISQKIRLNVGEGITGWVVQHKKTVFIPERAYQDPRFKLFKSLPADAFEAFLSIPILLNSEVLGVVNLQYKNATKLTRKQIEVIERLVDIIAYSFSMYVLRRSVHELTTKLKSRKIVERAKGILMEKFNISEDEAFAKMRTEAMKQRKKIEDLATSIILIEKMI